MSLTEDFIVDVEVEDIEIVIDDEVPNIDVIIKEAPDAMLVMLANIGPPGDAGEKWFSGVGVPPGNLGSISDWYMDSSSGNFYEKTDVITWTLRGNLKGPQGDVGSTGPQGPPGPSPSMTSARVARTTTQAIPKNVLTPITFDLERYDNGGCWAVGQPTRLVAPVAGIYNFWGSLLFASDTVGRQRQAIVRLNGTTRIADGGPQAGAITAGTVPVNVSGQIQMAAGDYIELCAMHDSTTNNINVTYTAWEFNEFGFALAGGPVGPQGPVGPSGSVALPGVQDGEFAVWDAGTVSWVRSTSGELIKLAAQGFQFGSDVNLYRSAANILKTDDNLVSGGYIAAHASVIVDNDNIGSKLYFGSVLDTNLYRSAADVLKTDDNFVSQGTISSHSGGNGFTSVTPVGARSLQTLLLIADVEPAFYILGNGEMRWGAGGSSAVDTNLYRVAADSLRTDDHFTVGGNFAALSSGFFLSDIISRRANVGDPAFYTQLNAEAGSGLRFRINADGKLSWGSGNEWNGDTNLYRAAASLLRTDGSFEVIGSTSLRITNIYGDQAFPVLGITNAIYMRGTIVFHDGANYDTTLYRASADVLKTDDELQVSGVLRAAWTGSSWGFDISGNGAMNLRGSNAGIAIGDALTLYRAATGIARATGSLQIDGSVWLGLSGDTNLRFGPTGDVFLYRFAAGILKTDGELQVNTLKVGGVPVSGGAVAKLGEASLASNNAKLEITSLDQTYETIIIEFVLYTAAGTDGTTTVTFDLQPNPNTAGNTFLIGSMGYNGSGGSGVAQHPSTYPLPLGRIKHHDAYGASPKQAMYGRIEIYGYARTNTRKGLHYWAVARTDAAGNNNDVNTIIGNAIAGETASQSKCVNAVSGFQFDAAGSPFGPGSRCVVYGRK